MTINISYNGWTEKKLDEFTKEIAKIYEQGKIKAPIHLCGGNDIQLIEIFKKNKISKNDYIFVTWRNSYHWLLSGRSPEVLEKQILAGHSMHVCDRKFFTSSIVGGIAPIALGVAMALKKKKSKNKVWCFIGDMAATGGLFQECVQYATGHNLPMTFVIEDNGRSVRANTKKVWGLNKKSKVIRYKYKPKFPHAGSGKYVMF